jgi:hypothetical protein
MELLTPKVVAVAVRLRQGQMLLHLQAVLVVRVVLVLHRLFLARL